MTRQPLDDLTIHQIDALSAIDDASLDEPHGLAIKEVIEESYGKEVHISRLYPNLDGLADKGLVKKGEQDKRTNYYTLTRRGERELQTYREWQSEQRS